MDNEPLPQLENRVDHPTPAPATPAHVPTRPDGQPNPDYTGPLPQQFGVVAGPGDPYLAGEPAPRPSRAPLQPGHADPADYRPPAGPGPGARADRED